MKTQEQLMEEIKILLKDSLSDEGRQIKNSFFEDCINLVVEACEEAVENKDERIWEYPDPEMQGVFSIGRKEERRRILQNLKKLKSK